MLIIENDLRSLAYDSECINEEIHLESHCVLLLGGISFLPRVCMWRHVRVKLNKLSREGTGET